MTNYKNLDTSKLNYVIYCRKSSEGEDKQVQSLETQLRELNEHAERNNLNIIETVIESKSAHTVGREGFSKVIELIKSKKANAILVIRANRISRNAVDAGQIISLMDEKKLLFIRTPNATSYTSSSSDRMMIALELIFSKKDSDDKGEMVKEGQKTKALKGFPHGVATLGFLNDRSEEKGNRKWLEDKDRFWKIEKLFEMFLTGNYSAGKLFEHAVNDLKLTTVQRKRTGGRPIVLSRIYEILKDPVYAGFFFYDGIRYELDKSLPRAITEAEHEKVLRLLSRKNIPKVQHHKVVYSGYVTSPEGNYIGGEIKKQLICDCKKKFAYSQKEACPNCQTKIEDIRNPKYLQYNKYINIKLKKARVLDKSISVKSVDEKAIDKKLIEVIENDLFFADGVLEWAKKYIYEVEEIKVKEKVLLEMNREKRARDYSDKKAKIRNRLYENQITDDEYKEDISRLEKEYSDLKEEKRATEGESWISKLNKIISVIEIAKDTIQNGTYEEKRQLLSDLGPNLIWDEEKLIVINKKSIQKLSEAIKFSNQEYAKSEPKKELVITGLNRKISPFKTDFSIWLRG